MTNPSELVFVSYSKKDVGRLLPIYEQLKRQGFNLWLDQEELLPGQQWEEEIIRVIKTARIFLLFLSSTWVESKGYVQKELKVALDVVQELPSDQVFIVPVRLDDCKVPRELSELNWMDLWDAPHMEKLVGALKTIIKGDPAEYFIQTPILLGNTEIKKGSQAVLDKFYDMMIAVLASDKINKTWADGQEHSAMYPAFQETGFILVIVHAHPGAPAVVAPKIRGILSERLNLDVAAAFLKNALGVLMLDYFVEKLSPADLQPLRVSLAVTFLPRTTELPEEVRFVVAHREMLRADEWRQLVELYGVKA